MCVCVCLSENGVYPVPLPVIEHNYWTWIKLSLIYLLTKKVIFRGYLGHIRQPTVVIHPPVWTAPSNSLNQFTQILLMADVDNLSPKDQKKCGSNESPVWPGSFPILLMVIFHVYPHVQTNPLIWWVSPIWTNDTPPKNGKPRLKRQGSPKRCGTCSFQLVQEYVPHNSQVSNLSMVGGCYVPMSQVSAPKNGWLSRLSSFVEVSWVRNFHPDRPCLYLGFQKPSKTGLQKKHYSMSKPIEHEHVHMFEWYHFKHVLHSGHVTVIQSFLLNIPQATLPLPPAPRNAREKPWTWKLGDPDSSSRGASVLWFTGIRQING